jgi:multiple sugar transport system substrate-binding protein
LHEVKDLMKKFRHFPTKKRWMFLIILSVSLLFSGCGLAATPTPDPITLVFSYPNIDNAFYESLLPLFNKDYPHILIELNPLPEGMLNGLGAEETDLIAANVFYLRELQAEKGILGLNSVMEKDDSFNRSDYLLGTVDFLSLDGETWAVPVGADLDVMYFNKDLFDQNGLPYPETGWNWDDFLTYALTISNPNAVSGPIYGYTTIPGNQDVYSFIYQHGGTLFNDVRYPSEPTFNTPLTVEAIEFFADLFYVHGVAPTPAEARRSFSGGQYAYLDAISRGSIGMWSLPLSQRGGYGWPVEWSVNWGVTVLPRDAQPFAPFWVEEGYAISTGTDNPDESWQWMNFLSRQINPRLIPTRQSLIESTAYEDLVGEEVAAVVRQSLVFAVPISLWQWISLGGAINTFNDAIESVLAGSTSPQEALDRAQELAKNQMP